MSQLLRLLLKYVEDLSFVSNETPGWKKNVPDL